MRVAFCTRPNYDNPLGGDAIQMLKTKEYLEKIYQLNIDIITDPEKISQVYDIVHVFNFSTYKISKKFIDKSNLLNIKIVTSSIYWDYSYASTTKLFYLFPGLNYLDEFSLNLFRKIIIFIGKIFPKPDVVSSKFKKNVKWMFERSTIVAPNSDEEAELLLKWIDVRDFSKIRVVYNASENKKIEKQVNKEEFLKKYQIPDNYILQVGRIEYCKNQLNLIAALKNNPEIPLVFVGKIVDNKYYNKILKLADKRGNVYFIDAVEHSEIGYFYQFAKIHVLLSLRESPGLVNIEALINNCPIVISDERFLPVKTYFNNQPYVVNPLNIKKVKEIVLDAYKNRVIYSFDFKKFSWDNVSKQTYDIYTEVLQLKSRF